MTRLKIYDHNTLNMKKFLRQTILLASLSLNVPRTLAADIDISPPPNLKILDFGKLVSALIGAALFIAVIAAFLYLLLGGFNWITSGGDKAGVEAAQKKIQAAIIGLIVVFAAWAIMLLISKFLGIENPFQFDIPTVTQ